MLLYYKITQFTYYTVLRICLKHYFSKSMLTFGI
jgi:hypothetical protein